MLILSLKIVVAVLFALVLACAYYARREKKPVRRYPCADPHLEYYDRDYVVLSESIDRAMTLRQLDYANTFISQFKTRYEQYQEPSELITDLHNLKKKYREKRNLISTMMQATLN
jgi:hypothetical protein